MVIIAGTLALTSFTAYLARRYSRPTGLEPWQFTPNTFFLVLTVCIFIFVAGLRSNIGDTSEYMDAFKYLVRTDISFAFESKEVGFGLYQVLLKSISSNPQILIFVSTAIIYLLIFKTLRKYANPFDLAVFLFVVDGTFVSSMNGLRQYIAAAVLFAACRYIFEGNFKKYLLFVILAASFHTTALVMIIFYFIVRKQAWSRATMFIILGAVAAFIALNLFLPQFLSLLENTMYANYAGSWFTSGSENGANPLRVLVMAIPVALSFLGRDRLRELGMFGNVLTNMSILTFAIYFISTFNWVFARFAMYTGLFNLLLLPFLMRYTFSRRDTKILCLLGVLMYLMYFYYDTAISMGITYESIVLGIGGAAAIVP